MQQQNGIDLSNTLTVSKKDEKIQMDLSDRPYLNIAEVAKLLGVCRQTVYNFVYSGKIKATRITSKLTFISREKLDEWINNEMPYKKTSKAITQPITEWYTLSEITEKYGIKYRRLRDIINKENIPEKKDGKLTLIAKNKIDVYFKKQGYNETTINLTDWITISEIMKQYEITENTAYSFVSDYNIPKKQQNGKRYYSKQHIDTLKYKGQ
jgi:excisionase family DNA binding protein